MPDLMRRRPLRSFEQNYLIPGRGNLSDSEPITDNMGDLRQTPKLPPDVLSYIDQGPPAPPPEGKPATAAMASLQMSGDEPPKLAPQPRSVEPLPPEPGKPPEEKTDYNALLAGLGDSLRPLKAYGFNRHGVIPVGGLPPAQPSGRITEKDRAELALKKQHLDTEGAVTPALSATLAQRDRSDEAQARRSTTAQDAIEAYRNARLKQGEGAAGRAAGAQERANMLAERVPSEDRRSLSQMHLAKTTIDQVMKEAADPNTEFGPIAGRATLVFRRLGLADPDTIGTAARLSDAINKYIYASTGKQLNTQEMKRLEGQLPQVWDSPAAFQKIGSVFKEQLQRAEDETLSGLEREGYNVAKWREGSAATPGAGPAGGGAVPGFKGTPEQEAAYLKAKAEWDRTHAGSK